MSPTSFELTSSMIESLKLPVTFPPLFPFEYLFYVGFKNADREGPLTIGISLGGCMIS